MNAWDPLADWVSAGGLGSLVGAGRRVKFPLSSSLPPLHSLPLAPKRSISPWLTCETQGWEPLRRSVRKIKIYRNMTGLEGFMTCAAPIPPTNLFVPGGAGAVYD